MLLNKRIKEEREILRLTQEEMAEKIGVSPAAVGLYEQGRRNPDYETLLKYADIYGCSVDYLLGRVNDRTEELQKPNDGQRLIASAKDADVSINELEAYIEARKSMKNRKDS